ncbi:DUF6300 family protein [Streptomyces sp. NPDC003006]
MKHNHDEIVLRLAGAETSLCGSCGLATLLQATFPHSWRNARGEEVAGLRQAALCRSCDHGDPASDGLLALFPKGQQFDVRDLEAFGGLAAAWVEAVRHRVLDTDLLADQEALWHRGEL